MKKGFTLNELLIAMTIIGIIAVLFTPRLLSNIDKKTKVTALQRVHSSINEAIGTLMLDERAKKLSLSSLCADDASYDMASSMSNFLTKYLKVKKDCGLNVSECLAPAYKNVEGADVVRPANNEAYCAILNNGSSVCIRNATQDAPARIWVDTNGSKGPNMAGRDYFRFFVYNDGFITDGLSDTGTDPNLDPIYGSATLEPEDCLSNVNGGGCLTRIMRAEWVMDY